MRDIIRKYRWWVYWLVMFGVNLFAQAIINALFRVPTPWVVRLVMALIYATVWVGLSRWLWRRGIFGQSRK